MDYKLCTYPGFEGLYRIYEDGQIYSLRKKRFLKPALQGYHCYQYHYITLIGENKEYLRTPVHRLVAHHFISPQPSKYHEINHKDLNKLNNHFTNLEWVTHSQNMIYARSNKSWQEGRPIGFKVSLTSKQKMAQAKYKKILLYNDNEQIIYNSIEQFITEQKTYRKKFQRLVNSCKTFKGYYIRYV